MPRYTTVHKNRNLESDPESHIARPPNCFMLWSCEMRNKMAKSHPNVNNADVSKLLGHMWMSMSSDCKIEYRIKADTIKYEHKILYPNYKYIPKSKIRKNKAKVNKENKDNKVKYVDKHKLKKNIVIKQLLKTQTHKMVIIPREIIIESEPEPDYYSEIELFYKHICDI
jgi:hypothetical protein